MLKLFVRYTSVGVINTLLHWLVFAILFFAGASQTIANLAAFCVAVTFSFFVNARWTFGKLADRAHINPVITLVAFSAISLVFGFIYSRFIVFRVKK